MRYGLLLCALVACAQQPDSRGFVNERLLRQNFAKNALTPKAQPPARAGRPAAPARILAGAPQGQCDIPLLPVPMSKDVDLHMIAPQAGTTGDEKMIVPTIPACPKK